MPVLRSGPDNTLAETLGNLGSSLAQGLNPMNQIRANNMQSEIQQRNWELQQKQSMDAANRNAANVFYNSDLPFDPSTKEMIASQLRNGTLNVTSYIDALTKTGNLKANRAAADMYRATHGNLSPADLESNVAQLIGGNKTAAELDAQEATTKLTTLKTDQTVSGVAAARTPAAKEAAALGQPETGVKLDAGDTVANTHIDPTAPDAAAQRDKLNAANLAAGYGRPPLGTALAPSLQGSEDAATAAREAEIARQKGVAKVETEGLPQTGNVFLGPLPGQKGNQTGAPYDVTQTPDTAQTVSLPNEASPASVPAPVTRTIPGTGTVVGETAPEAAERQKIDTDTQTGIKEDIASGEAGQKMMMLLDRLNTLADLANTATVGGQFTAAVINKLREYHIVSTNRAGVLAEMASLFQAQIPELRKDMGVKFEAGPELSAQGKMIGDPSLPVETLKGIFARQATVAKLGIGLRDLAIRAGQPGQAKPLTRTEYLNQRAGLYDNLTSEMQQQIKDYGGFTKETLAPPKPPPATTGNSVMDSIKALLRHMGGADDQPQTPAPAPNNATEVIDVDANGRVFKR